MGNSTLAGKMKGMVVNYAPNQALKLFAKGYVLSNDYSSYILPQLFRYYLPIGK